jgi:hypothetical protein
MLVQFAASLSVKAPVNNGPFLGAYNVAAY